MFACAGALAHMCGFGRVKMHKQRYCTARFRRLCMCYPLSFEFSLRQTAIVAQALNSMFAHDCGTNKFIVNTDFFGAKCPIVKCQLVELANERPIAL